MCGIFLHSLGARTAVRNYCFPISGVLHNIRVLGLMHSRATR